MNNIKLKSIESKQLSIPGAKISDMTISDSDITSFFAAESVISGLDISIKMTQKMNFFNSHINTCNIVSEKIDYLIMAISLIENGVIKGCGLNKVDFKASVFKNMTFRSVSFNGLVEIMDADFKTVSFENCHQSKKATFVCDEKTELPENQPIKCQ